MIRDGSAMASLIFFMGTTRLISLKPPSELNSRSENVTEINEVGLEEASRQKMNLFLEFLMTIVLRKQIDKK